MIGALTMFFFDLTYADIGQPKPNIVFSGGLRPPLAYQNELNHLEPAQDCRAKLFEQRERSVAPLAP